MVATVLIALFFLLLIGLLLIPIEICIDTTKSQYYLRLGGLAKASIEAHEVEVARIRLRVFFRNFYFYPLRKIGGIKRKKIAKKPVKKRKRKMAPRKILHLLKSFKIKKLVVDLDTGNCISNAKLYPVFTFLNYYKGRYTINFEGRNQVVMFIHNRPLCILKSFINP